MSELDAEAFAALCGAFAGAARPRASIGQLGEKTLHAVCKSYFEPDTAKQEVPVGRFVADCFDGAHITEVQTRSFYPLQKKLAFFLQSYPVTVVKPVIRQRTVFWADPATGVFSQGRKSPKKGRFSDILEDLFWLDGLFPHEGLTVTVLLTDVHDLRLRDGFGPAGKSHATRQDILPVSLCESVTLRTPAQAAALLPPLPRPFTLKELQKAACMTPRMAAHAVKFLIRHGLVQKTGKRGNAFLYEQAASALPGRM
ncbi:MAG: hypothetical protein Q4G07_04610 [Oscillospiraceae bacterium]|nr:hypothetical protein [Oscillospiraceae bacterium]